MRFDHVDGEGTPTKPNWEDLAELRSKQTLTAVQRAGKDMSKTEREAHIEKLTLPIKGFIDAMGGIGEKPFADENEGDIDGKEALHIEIENIALEELCENASFRSLHPRERQRILLQVGLADVKSQASNPRSTRGLRAKERQMQNSLGRATMTSQFRDKVEEVGEEKAKNLFAPWVERRAGKKPKATTATKSDKKTRRSGAGKKRAAKAKAAQVKKLGADLAEATMKLQAALEETAPCKKAPKVDAANPDQSVADGVAENTRRMKLANSATMRTLQIEDLVKGINAELEALSSATLSNQSEHTKLSKVTQRLSYKVKHLSHKQAAAARAEQLPQTKLQPEHACEHPASGPVPASQSPSAAAPGPSQAAPLSAPSTQGGAQSSGPAAGSSGPAIDGSGAAAAASGPAAQGSCHQGSVSATGSSGPAARAAGLKATGSGAAAKASRRAPDHKTLIEALAAGSKCKKCVATSKFTKGCQECMGHWFAQLRQKSARKSKDESLSAIPPAISDASSLMDLLPAVPRPRVVSGGAPCAPSSESSESSDSAT